MSTKNCSGVYALDDMGWYRKQMRAAQVLPLCKTSNIQKESFRFTWLRTFDNPIVVTLKKTGNKIQLYAVRLDGAGGYDPGKITERRNEVITPKEYDEFSKIIEESNFWTRKSEYQIFQEAVENSGEVIVTTDGAQWIFEGSNYYKVHSFDRTSPNEDAIYKIGIFLLEKSKVKLNGPIY
jgi:uncharacterized protein YneR